MKSSAMVAVTVTPGKVTKVTRVHRGEVLSRSKPVSKN
jgi:hypothetical protein